MNEPNQEALTRALDLAGCYVVTTDVARADLSAQQVHDSYVSLGRVERDFRTLKTGLLEVRPVWVRKESRTRGHVFCCMLALKIGREMERRLRAAFGTTDTQRDAITLPDALLSLSRLCLLHYPIDEKTTVTKLPQPDARQRKILEALGVPPPVMSSGASRTTKRLSDCVFRGKVGGIPKRSRSVFRNDAGHDSEVKPGRDSDFKPVTF